MEMVTGGRAGRDKPVRKYDGSQRGKGMLGPATR